MNDHDAPEETVWAGRFLAAKRRGRWEYVARAGDIHAAVILAIDAGEVVLVEQYRVPLGCRSLELPAGLVGDGDADETVEASAARELEEETGYRAERIVAAGSFCSSPGMSSEAFTLVLASGLHRVGEGGGEGDEDITVHRVALAEVAAFVERRRADGVAIDVKLLLLLAGSILDAPGFAG